MNTLPGHRHGIRPADRGRGRVTHPRRAGDTSRPGGVTPAAGLHQRESPARDAVTLVTPVFMPYPKRGSVSNRRPSSPEPGQRPRLPTAAHFAPLVPGRQSSKGRDARRRAPATACLPPVSPRGPLRAAFGRLAKVARRQAGRARRPAFDPAEVTKQGAKLRGKSEFQTSRSNRVRDDIPAPGKREGQKIPYGVGGSAKTTGDHQTLALVSLSANCDTKAQFATGFGASALRNRNVATASTHGERRNTRSCHREGKKNPYGD